MKLEDIQISDKWVGTDQPPLILAEMSGNHNQSLSRALEIVEAASEAGAHAIKIQTYTADTMTIDSQKSDFKIDDLTSPWHGRNLYELYEEAHTPWEWHGPIIELCRKKNLACISTPFDDSAVDFLVELGIDALKIASFENKCLPLIKKAASTNLPIIISTGMASAGEMDAAVRQVREVGNDKLILLKCTSSYPATPEGSHVRSIPHMRDLFGLHVGISDHTLGIGTSLAAVAMGAPLVERHFTLSRADGGVDSDFSLEPSEMKNLVGESLAAWQSLGRVHYGPVHEEKSSMVFRRSLYIVEDIKIGDVLTKKNLRMIRPGYGLDTIHFETLLGKKISCDLERGTALSWEHIA